MKIFKNVVATLMRFELLYVDTWNHQATAAISGKIFLLHATAHASEHNIGNKYYMYLLTYV